LTPPVQAHVEAGAAWEVGMAEVTELVEDHYREMSIKRSSCEILLGRLIFRASEKH